MKKKYTIEEEVQRTMASLDQVGRAETDPYFSTRLKARMAREAESKSNTFFWLRPAILVPVIGLMLTVEGVYFVNQGKINLTVDKGATNVLSAYFELEADLKTFELQ